MKRRKFIHYGVLGGTSFLINAGLVTENQANASFSINTSNNRFYDWIFLYWMPYDNNLSRFGMPIIEMLSGGVQSENILVLVESKISGDKQLSRRIITKGNVDIQQLETANSAREEVFAEYLNWARLQFRAKKWAIVFLGHGGRLDAISPDKHPGVGLGTQWMNIKKLRDVIADFNSKIDDRVELIFFQNCNKGTIEATYTLRDAAKYTLASQITLGAPNYYYEQLLQFLGRNPDVDGGQLAEKIIEFERSDMYHSYTVTTNKNVSELPLKINPLIDSILLANVAAIRTREIKTYNYFGDRFVDAVVFFKTLAEQSGAEQGKLNEFIKFLNNSMIYKVEQSGTLLGPRRRDYQNLSGLGLFLPTTKQQIEKYRYLPVYSDLKLVELFDAILFKG